MWHEVESDGYELGDVVEVKSKMGKLNPLFATMADIFWNRHDQRIDYYLISAGQRLIKPYRIDELQPARILNRPMSLRQIEMSVKSRIG